MAQTVKGLADEKSVSDLAGDRWTSQVFGAVVPANQTQLTITTKWNVPGSRCKNS
jgi:hypothetical protein